MKRIQFKEVLDYHINPLLTKGFYADRGHEFSRIHIWTNASNITFSILRGHYILSWELRRIK